MAVALSAVTEDDRSRARRLVDGSIVFNATEAVRTGPKDAPRLLLGTDEIQEESLILEWKAQGYTGVLIPHGWIDVDDLARGVDHHLRALKVFSKWTSFIARHPEQLLLVGKRGDFQRAKESGRIAFVLGAHNGGDMFFSEDDVAEFYDYGMRHTLITCFNQNRIGTSVDEGVDRDGGLTKFGRRIIGKMNEVGMAVDVSHCAPKTRREAIDFSTRPVVLSHGNASAVRQIARNNDDDMLRALAANGGVIGLMFWRPMVKAAETVTIEDVLDHFSHVADVIGPQHIGLGLEIPMLGMDQCVNLPSAQVRYLDPKASMDLPDLLNSDRIRILTEGLVRRGFADGEIAGMLGGNFARAFDLIFNA